MAFFNLTYLGQQDPIKVTCERSSTTSTKNAKKVEVTSSAKPEENGTSDKGDLSRVNHNGSYVKYTELMRKHTRNPLGILSMML